MDKCTLQVGQQTLKPGATTSPWRGRHDAGGQSYVVDKDEVANSPQTADAQHWTVKSDDGHRLCWLASNRNTAYLLGYTHSIFFAVSRGPAEAWAGYLSDCIVYEINDKGTPISMVTLPQMIKGSQHSTQKGGVIWKCQNDTFVKLNPVQGEPVVSMGGGGADGTSCVAWLHHLQHAEPAAWFSAGKAQDVAAFGDTHAFCLPAGGYVSRSDTPVYRFPISAVDLATGLDTELLLDVPFKGQIPIPETNFRSTTLPDGTHS